MGWDKNNPENTFYNYAFRYGNNQSAFQNLDGYNDEFSRRSPINYPAITGNNNLPIIDIMVLGYDWDNKNGVLFSIDPSVLMNNVGSRLTTNRAISGDGDNNPNWRPDMQVAGDDPMNGFDINHDNGKPNMATLNPRLDVNYGARANASQEYVYPYFSELEGRASGANMHDGSYKISRFFILYNSITIANYICARGYRIPDPTNPNARRNWFSINLKGTSQNGFLKVFYLTYDDWLLNFSPRNGISFTLNSGYYPRNGDAIAKNEVNEYNTLFNGQSMYSGSALYSNDLRFKMYYDFYGKGHLYTLPLSSSLGNSYVKTQLSHNETQELNAIVPFVLAMQTDGNIVGYKINRNGSFGRPTLASGTNNSWTANTANCVLEAGGVLVGYSLGNGVDGKTILSDRTSYATNDKYNRNCNYYWHESPNGSQIIDISNGKCYRNPRHKYDWNGKVVKTDSNRQFIFWYSDDPTSVDMNYPYTYRDSWIIRSYYNSANDSRIYDEQRRNINYCMSGGNWLQNDCSNYANQFPTNSNLYNLINHDITNRICANPSTDNEYKMCAFIKPTHPDSTINNLLRSIINKAPDLKYLNPYIVNNYTFKLPGNRTTSDLGSTVANAIRNNTTFTDLELYFIRPYVQSVDNGATWADTYSKSLRLSDLPTYTPSDFNISGATLSKFNIFPFIVVFNYNNTITASGLYVDYFQLKNKDPNIRNNVYPQTSDVWKYFCRFMPTKMFNPYSLKRFDVTLSDTANVIRSTFGEWMYGMLMGSYKAYNMETLYCGNDTNSPQVYVFTLMDYKSYFIQSHINQNKVINPHGAPITEFNPLDAQTCIANPDWCYNEYLTYLNDPNNFNTAGYVKICDGLSFTGTNATNIKNACSNSLGINKCSAGELRYNSVPINATGRTNEEYQKLWNSAGCTTNVSEQYAGALTSPNKKDLWDLYGLAGVSRDMAAYSASTESIKRKMCYGSSFTNKENFSGGTCIDICASSNISADLKENCQKGTISFCKTGENIFTTQCDTLLTTIPELNTFKTDFCKNNPTNSRCPQPTSSSSTSSTSTTPTSTSSSTQPSSTSTTQPSSTSTTPTSTGSSSTPTSGAIQSSDVYNDPVESSSQSTGTSSSPSAIKTTNTTTNQDTDFSAAPEVPVTSASNGLSQTTIILIVIGCILFVILVAVFGFIKIRKMKSENIKLTKIAENKISDKDPEMPSNNVDNSTEMPSNNVDNSTETPSNNVDNSTETPSNNVDNSTDAN